MKVEELLMQCLKNRRETDERSSVFRSRTVQELICPSFLTKASYLKSQNVLRPTILRQMEKKFPFFFRQRVKLLVRFILRLRVSSNADSENVSEALARWLPLYRIRISSQIFKLDFELDFRVGFRITRTVTIYIKFSQETK